MSNANIHGIDHNNSNNGDNADVTRHYEYDLNSGTSIYSKFSYKGDPLKQSVISFIKETLCPFFTFKSFSFVVIVINIVLYIVTLCVHGLDGFFMYFDFLPPHSTTLRQFGCLNGYLMRQNPAQFYRWITHNFLHAGFAHVFSNCFCILFFGTMLEYLIGTWRYILIYFLSGILGGLFSVLIKPGVSSVGASICCYGAIAAILGFDLVNWNHITTIYGTQNKCQILMIPIFAIIFILPLQFTPFGNSPVSLNERINIFGHLGGLIFGLLLSFFIIKPKEAGFSHKIYVIVGISCCGIFTLTGFLCFYLMNKYMGTII